MEISLAQKAISLALTGNWDDAIKINLQILESSPNDIDALNRLARAYSELGKVQEAKKFAQKVIVLDPFNTIAQKCLDKLHGVKSMTKNENPAAISPEAFLEESGKTKLVTLLNVSDGSTLAALDPGEEVKISSYSHKVSIITADDKYIGRLPDDLAARLRTFIKSGYKYQVLVKSVQPKEVTVFIREIQRGDGSSATSFPTEKIEYVSFTPPELVHKEQPEPALEEAVEE